MSKRKPIFLLMLLSSLAAGLFSFSQKETLNASAASEFNGYYSSFNFDLKGKQLLGAVHDLITKTHTTYMKYDDSGPNLYQQETDQYYDESGNKVEGYIHDFYTGLKWTNDWDPNAKAVPGGYNREHVWPKSLSNGLWETSKATQKGPTADMHHIRPTEVRLNSSRNNNRYGNIEDFGFSKSDTKAYAKLGTNETYAVGGYVHAPSSENSVDVFEPLSNKKGDVARIILYQYVHYSSYNSSLLKNYATTNGTAGESSYFGTLYLNDVINTPSNTEEAAIQLLLAWNKSDKVDDIERRRNDVVYKYQGNRNPFIDYEDLIYDIWDYEGGTSGGDTPDTPVVPDTPVTPTPNGDYGVFGEVTKDGIYKASSINVGDTVYLVSEGASMQLSGFPTSGTMYGVGTAYDTTPQNIFPLTVTQGYTSDTYAFKTTDNKYLYSINTNTNTLNVNATLNANTSWSVDIDETSTNAVIKCQSEVDKIGTDDTIFDKRLAWNVSNPRFANYKVSTLDGSSKNNYKAVQLYKYVQYVDPTGGLNRIILSSNSLYLNINETTQLRVTSDPVGVEVDVSWSNTNPSVASVNNGRITAFSSGTTTITATVVDKDISASCVVTVGKNTYFEDMPSDGELALDYEFTHPDDIDDGQYVLASKIDNSYKVMSNTFATKMAKVDFSNFASDTVLEYAYDITNVTSEGENYLTISNSDISLGYESSTNFANSTGNWKINKTSDAYTLNSSVNNERAILYRSGTYNIFGAYASSNLSNAEYHSVQLYKVDTAINLLVNKLINMDCNTMMDSTFKTYITYLKNKLNAEENEFLRELTIKCIDGSSYNALHAYNYAISRVSLANNNPILILKNIADSTPLITTIVVCVLLSFASIYLHKKRKTQ